MSQFKNKYEFYGTDFKSEIKAAVFAAIILILVWSLVLVAYYHYYQLGNIRHVPFGVFLTALFSGLSACIFSLKLIGKRMQGTWVLSVENKCLTAEYNKEEIRLPVQDIQKISMYGNSSFLYLTIVSPAIKLKIRTGDNFLAPFSNKEDIEKLKLFIKKELEPYLKINFIKKDNRVALSPQGVIKLKYRRK